MNDNEYQKLGNQLFIPTINGFKRQDDVNPKTIISTKSLYYGITIQVISEGSINNNSFDNKLAEVIKNEKSQIESQSDKIQSNFIYFRDSTNGIFNFKILVCDIVDATEINNKQASRKLYTFFVEPMNQVLYKLVVSVGPLKMPTEQLKLGTIDLQNDQVTYILNDITNMIIKGLKYKDNELNNPKRI